MYIIHIYYYEIGAWGDHRGPKQAINESKISKLGVKTTEIAVFQQYEVTEALKFH